MAIAQGNDFLASLQESRLLGGHQYCELQKLRERYPNDHVLARIALQRKWLTAYQVNRLMQGKTEGLRIGAYQLLQKLGEGGMGEVYKAKQEESGQMVAIKLLRPKLLTNEVAVLRFQREVRVISQLSHPNVVHFLDAGVEEGQHYFAMEFIEGIDLARMVKAQGPLNVRQACEYIRQTALALQHGFERGLVHRDIKPANILVTAPPPSFLATLDRFQHDQIEKWGMVKVLDMGLARVISQDEQAASTLLTQLNVVMGTPDFISPEQAVNSHECDIRSDLYSLGCTLYFLLTGKPPFPTGNATEKLLQHRLDKPAAVEKVRRSELIARGADPRELKYLSSRVGKLLRKLMDKKPENRFQTPGELAEALTSILDSTSGVGSVRDHTSATTVKTALVSQPAAGTATQEQSRNNRKIIVSVAPANQAAATAAVKRGRTRKLLRATMVTAGILVLLLIGILVGAVIHSRSRHNASTIDTAPTVAKLEWKKLQEKLSRPVRDVDRTWQDLLDFRLSHPDSPEAQFVTDWYLKLRSPLDHLRRDNIPTNQRYKWQKKHHVAVVENLKHRTGDRTDAALALAFSPSLRYFAASWAKSGIVVWRTAALPQPYAPLADSPSAVAKLVFSSDGGKLALGGKYGNVAVYDAATQKITPCATDSTAALPAICALGFSSDSKSLVAVDAEGEVREWTDLSAGESAQLFASDEWSELTAAAISSDATIIIKAHANGRIMFLPRGKTTLAGHEHELNSSWQPVTLAISQNNRFALVGCTSNSGGSFVVAFRRTGDRFHLLGQFALPDSVIRHVVLSPDGQHFLTADDKKLQLWNLDQSQALENWEFRSPIESIALAPDGRHAGLAFQNGLVYLLRLSSPPHEKGPRAQ